AFGAFTASFSHGPDRWSGDAHRCGGGRLGRARGLVVRWRGRRAFGRTCFARRAVAFSSSRLGRRRLTSGRRGAGPAWPRPRLDVAEVRRDGELHRHVTRERLARL